MAFHVNIRRQIYERAGKHSELDPRNIEDLECSHLSHNHGLIEYNSAEMGVLCSSIEHLAYHLIFQDQPELIGLSNKNNYFAIRCLYSRVEKQSSDRNIDSHELARLIEQAKNEWYYYLEL